MEDEKNSELIPTEEIQEITRSMATSFSLQIEEITKNSKNIFQDLQPAMKNIQKITSDFSSIFSLNLQYIKPVLEKIGSIQRDFFNSVQWETLQNIAKRLKEMTPEEMETLVEEVNKEVKRLTN